MIAFIIPSDKEPPKAENVYLESWQKDILDILETTNIEDVTIKYTHNSGQYCCINYYGSKIWYIYDPNDNFVGSTDDEKSARSIVNELNSLL